MNMRKRKLAVMAAMYYITVTGRWHRHIDKLMQPTLEEQAAAKAENRKIWDELLSEVLPRPKIYVVARVKDNEVVLETEDLAEAEETILKAAKQKKAKLHLLETA